VERSNCRTAPTHVQALHQTLMQGGSFPIGPQKCMYVADTSIICMYVGDPPCSHIYCGARLCEIVTVAMHALQLHKTSARLSAECGSRYVNLIRCLHDLHPSRQSTRSSPSVTSVISESALFLRGRGDRGGRQKAVPTYRLDTASRGARKPGMRGCLRRRLVGASAKGDAPHPMPLLTLFSGSRPLLRLQLGDQ